MAFRPTHTGHMRQAAGEEGLSFTVRVSGILGFAAHCRNPHAPFRACAGEGRRRPMSASAHSQRPHAAGGWAGGLSLAR